MVGARLGEKLCQTGATERSRRARGGHQLPELLEHHGTVGDALTSAVVVESERYVSEHTESAGGTPLVIALPWAFWTDQYTRADVLTVRHDEQPDEVKPLGLVLDPAFLHDDLLQPSPAIVDPQPAVRPSLLSTSLILDRCERCQISRLLVVVQPLGCIW